MIDIHSHILPKVDDGAKSVSESLQMLKRSSEDGVKVIVATPHFWPGHYDVDVNQRDELVVQLQDLAEANGIPIQVKVARECYLCQDIFEYPSGLRQLTYEAQGRYMLVETSLSEFATYVPQILFEIQVQGITPIIAHPERYEDIIEDPNIAADYINRGCLMQLNAGSLMGKYGLKIKKTGELLLEHDMIHIIASDIHSPNSCLLSDGMKVATKILGEEAQKIVDEVPKSILKGESVAVKPPKRYKPRRFFMPLFR